jgi:hypothetical protein
MSGQHLSRLLLKLFAQGQLAGTTVFDLAAAAWEDGWGRLDPLATSLVRAGQGGKKRSLIAKHIIQAAEAAGLVCSKAIPYEVGISTGGTALVCLPHEFYPSMVANKGLKNLCLDAEALDVGTGLAKLLKDWAENQSVEFSGDLSEVGILGLHCDGVQYTSSVRAGGARSVVVGSMNVISAGNAVRHLRKPLFVLRKTRLCERGCQGFHTIQEIMDVVAWSMQCLLDGVTPSCRHDGSAWTRQDRQHRLPSGQAIPTACLLQIRGDWEWFEQCFRLRSVSSDSFCWMCEATQRTTDQTNTPH